MLVDVEGMEEKLLAGARTTLRRDLALLIGIRDDGKRREESMSTTRKQLVESIMRMGYTSIERVGDDDFLFSR
jgi:hypothetical protein